MTQGDGEALFAPSRFYSAWARLVVRHRWACTTLILGLTLFFGWRAALTITVDNSVEAFAPTDSEEIKTLHEYRDTFGRADAFVVLVEGDVFTLPFLKRLKALHSAIAKIDVKVKPPPRKAHLNTAVQNGVDGFDDDDDEGWGNEAGGSIMERVISLINMRQTRGGPQGIRVEKLGEPLPTEAQLPDWKKRILHDPLLVGQVVGAKGKQAIITAYAIDMYDGDLLKLTQVINELIRTHERPDFKILLTGPPAIAATLNDMVISDMQNLGLWSLAVVIMALGVLFRSLLGLIAPVLVVGVSVVWSLGFMALVGYPLTILSGILPAFLFCVGVGDSIHMLSVYRDRRRGGIDNQTAIIEAVAITGPPVFFTSITTTCGLLSLGFASVPAIVEMGISGGVGVMVAFLMSIWLLPILLTLAPSDSLGAADEGKSDFLDLFVDRCLAFSRPTKRARLHLRVLSFALVLASVAGFGMTQLKVMHDDLATVPQDSDVRRAAAIMDASMGGVATAELLITPTSKNSKDIEVLRGLERVVDGAKAYRDPQDGAQVVMHALSLVDIAKETRRALSEGRSEEYRLPDNQEQSNEILELFGQQSPSELKAMTTIDWSKTHLTLRAKWREATMYEPLIKHMDTLIETHLDGKAEMKGTGPIYIGRRIVAVLLDDLLNSFTTAFLFISALMIILLKDLKLGLVAMLPNLFPIALVLGFMGLQDIPIDLNNLLLASIALGIAVDDTVHFLHHFQTAFRVTQDRELALSAAKHHAGRAMLTTSIVLIGGFGTFMMALNIALMRFGILIALTVLCALLVDLIVLPALLRLIYPAQTKGRGPTTHDEIAPQSV